MIQFEIPLRPMPKQALERFWNAKLKRPMVMRPRRVRQHADAMASYMERHRPPQPMVGPVALTVVFVWRATAKCPAGFRIAPPDSDNCQKQVKDCLQRCGFIENDAQVCKTIAWKRSGPRAGIFVRLERLAESDWTEWKKGIKHGKEEGGAKGCE